MKRRPEIKFYLITVFILFSLTSFSQGFLHTSGKRIVDGGGKNVLLKGIGTGNWMLMEGYMMQTSGVAGTQHEFREKLENLIGTEKTDSFFNAWLSWHFTHADVDSMKAWGFNSIRVAMHYKWFTLPIEEEPVPGEQTWLNKGFDMMDSLLSWCADNEMYLIPDMHGAPGGQGKNADISDYDPSKPSLWESEANKDKTVALWTKLAKRYKDEPWIGGYDLINETNWDFENSGNENGVNCVLNIPLLELHKRIIDSIRTVDHHHIVFVSGNSWGNNYNGMNSLAGHDDNLAYTFHKYWSGTGPNDLDWIINKSKSLNVPLWLSESGENSNTWYTDMIALCESNNIGWSWWPVKKKGINNVLKVKMNDDYEALINYWKNPGTIQKPTEEEAFQAVLSWAANHKIQNCDVAYDVIDAMIRQPHTDEVIPFKTHQLTEPIFFSDFDLGKYGIAYADKYVANYGGEWTGWNNGWGLRNDGVDIEACSDKGAPNNGYNVGWTDDNEWMQYSMSSDSVAAYTLKIRHASGSGGSKLRLLVNGIDATETLSLPGTGGWQTWRYTSFEHVILPAGNIKLRIVIEKGGSNLNHFILENPMSIGEVPFELVSAETSDDGTQIIVAFNKEISEINTIDKSEFTVLVDGETLGIKNIEAAPTSASGLILQLDGNIYSDNNVTLSYKGVSILSGNQKLGDFEFFEVVKNVEESISVPGIVQAEDFIVNKGLVLEDCQDNGGGKNTGYANQGDYLIYKLHVTRSGIYRIAYRVATERSNAQLVFQVEKESSFNSLDTIQFENTGGWQTWKTQVSEVYLNEGYYNIRLLVKQGEHNLNWFRLIYTGTGLVERMIQSELNVFPNPASDYVHVEMERLTDGLFEINFYEINGKMVKALNNREKSICVDISDLDSGVYLIHTRSGEKSALQTFVKI